MTLHDAVLQWLETEQPPNSDDVLADVVAFKEDVRRFQKLQGRESKPGELRSTLERSLESWKAVYGHLGQCRTVERGKLSTTASKIRLVLTRLNDLVPKTDSSDAVANAPLYEGKPLEHWLDMLSREKSAAGLKSALDACSALGSPDNAQQITATLLKALPTIDGDLHLIPGDGGALNPDSFSIQLLRKLNKRKAYFELWVREFDAADRDWQTRLWMYVNQYGRLSSSEDVEPLVVWAENRLAQPASEDREANERAAEIANFLRNLTALNRQDVDAKLTERVSALLKSSPQLGETWWLSEPLVYRYGSEVTQHWTPQIKAEITRVAVEAVCKNDTDPSLVAQACMILSNGAELTNEQKAAVLSSIQRRLEEANQSPEALMSMVTIPEAFGSLGIPLTTGMSELSFVKVQISFQWSQAANVRTSKCSTVLQLLNVAYALDKDKVCQPQIQKIFDTSSNVFDIIHAQWLKYLKSRPEQPGSVVRRPSESTRAALDLIWPDLTSSIDGNAPIQPGTRDGLNVLLFRMLWGDRTPSREDWLKYLILLHPVMQETVTAEIEKAAQTPPAPEATTPGDSKQTATPSPDGNPTPK